MGAVPDAEFLGEGFGLEACAGRTEAFGGEDWHCRSDFTQLVMMMGDIAWSTF